MDEPAEVLAVRTATVQRLSGNARQVLLNASGYVTARRQATVASKVTGKVMEVLVEEGMKVQSGQVLARVDSSNVEKMCARRSSTGIRPQSLGRDQGQPRARRTRVAALHRLAKNKIASISVLDQAEADAKSLRAHLEKQKADVAVAERALAEWQQQLDDTVIRAPFSGIVTSKNAQPGEMISPMSSAGSREPGSVHWWI